MKFVWIYQDLTPRFLHELDGKKAIGIDGVDKASYGINLDENLRDLMDRMRRMAYTPGAVRQVLIPKEGKN